MSRIETPTIEQSYTANTNIDHRKKYAQFFTPQPIAQLMSQWLLANRSLHSVLEPAFGLGVFSRELLAQKSTVEIRAFEIDPKIYEASKDYFSTYPSVKLHLKDYMFNDWENKYDGIICNPPYFKFHDYDNKSILIEVERKLGFKLNGFTNLYTLFLLKSIYQLNENGRAAYIIPSEFLNSDYGTLVKRYLLESGTLRHIFVIDFNEKIFDDALTTASVLLLANDNHNTRIQISNISSANDLDNISSYIKSYPKRSGEYCYAIKELDPSLKWRRYYQKQNAHFYKNLVPFSSYAKVVRGIATGANGYFTFNQCKINSYSIPQKNLLPCICKAKDVKGHFFSEDNFQKLKAENELVYLFDAESSNNQFVKDYIQKGEREKINERYLTKCRKPWYKLENRRPAPIWVSVFNRKGLRFIRNEANISNLTTFHCVYPVKSSLFNQINIDLLFAYLLTDSAKKIFSDNRREYADGLEKFEPNDLNKAQMVDLSLLSTEKVDTILSLFNKYRKESNKSYIEEIDEIIVKEFGKA